MLEMLASQAVSSLAGGLGQSLGGGGADGPNLSGGPVSSWIDGSGWTVSTGGSKASGAVRSDSGLGAGSVDPALMWAAVAVVALIAWKKLGR